MIPTAAIRRLVALAILLLALGSTSHVVAQEIRLPVRIDRGPVTVRAAAGLDAAAARVAERAPDSLARIADDLRELPLPERIEVRLVPTSADLPRAAPPGHGAPDWAAGVAYPDRGIVAIAMRREHEPIGVLSTLDHELAHMALGAALGERAPRWLHEGFAYLHSSDLSMARLRTLTGMAWFGNVIPLREMNARFPARENAAARAYAQSYDFVAFLARRGRYADPGDDGDRWAFRDFLRKIGEGMTVYEAALDIYGVPLEELYAEWYQDLRERYLTMPAGLFAMSVWVLGAILLVLGWLRRRRQNRRRLAVMAAEERAVDLDEV